MNPSVDAYFRDGCGRCVLAGTPQCKVHQWTTGLKELRSIVLSCKLNEERKWGVPCYTYQQKNILLLSAFKEYGVLSFFKGALLKDPIGILEAPGKHSQAVRMFRFKDVEEIKKNKRWLKMYILEAIELEKAGKKVAFKKISAAEYPAELTEQFGRSSDFKKAFLALTPGRQRGYLLFFCSAKQSATRLARIEKCRIPIMKGKGLQD